MVEPETRRSLFSYHAVFVQKLGHQQTAACIIEEQEVISLTSRKKAMLYMSIYANFIFSSFFSPTVEQQLCGSTSTKESHAPIFSRRVSFNAFANFIKGLPMESFSVHSPVHEIMRIL